MKKTSLVLLVIVALKTSTCIAWGKVGHVMVAEIAISYLNKGVKDSAQKYLGKMTFGEAATWMDDIRNDHRYDFMTTWHYADIDKDKTYVKTEEENAINHLEKAISELKDKSKLTKEQITNDLKILFHLVGDIHQPLHCGYGSDKGGNSIEVYFNFQYTNLHTTWDTRIIEYKLANVQKDIIELFKKLTVSEKRKYEKINVEEWYKESRGYLPIVYDFNKGDITDEYVNKSLPIIEKQLLIAGLRLAGVLNEIFKK